MLIVLHVGNFLALPSRRTLCYYTHVMSANAGCDSAEKIVGIMLDGDEAIPDDMYIGKEPQP